MEEEEGNEFVIVIEDPHAKAWKEIKPLCSNLPEELCKWIRNYIYNVRYHRLKGMTILIKSILKALNEVKEGKAETIDLLTLCEQTGYSYSYCRYQVIPSLVSAILELAQDKGVPVKWELTKNTLYIFPKGGTQ